MFYSDMRKEAVNRAKDLEKQRNDLAEEGNRLSVFLYDERKQSVRAIYRVEEYINSLANSPKEFKKDICEVIAKLQKFVHAMEIEKQIEADNMKAAGTAAGGTAIGGAVAFLGPTAAMAVATTFGTASTGAAIAGLSGAAATNAALAWLGGGALAAGGGGMAAGNALLALAGPVGWGIAAASAIGGGAFASYKNKKAAEEANEYALKMQEEIYRINVIIRKITEIDDNTKRLRKIISVTPFNFMPKDYKLFSEDQKKALVALVNNTKALGVLINERI